MPANLPPQYYELERAFRDERDPREKLRMAEELLRIMPKHKGTDKLQADMKAKISKLKKLAEGGGEKQHGARQAPAQDHIEREGAGQVILIGPPNSGKSSLLDSLTNAQPLVADYPYSTREPQAGMMPFETIQIQLIDTPPISSELYEVYLSNLIRNVDIVLLVADLATDSMEKDLQTVLDILAEHRIELKPAVTGPPEDPRFSYKKALVCAHKEFEDDGGRRLERLRQMFGGFTTVPTSILDDNSLELLRRTIFESLGIIRVYTKPAGHEPDFKDPIILPHGGTVEQAAATLHRDIAEKLKFARVWGAGKFDGQRVQRDYVLSDGDVIEFHQ